MTRIATLTTTLGFALLASPCHAHQLRMALAGIERDTGRKRGIVPDGLADLEMLLCPGCQLRPVRDDQHLPLLCKIFQFFRKLV